MVGTDKRLQIGDISALIGAPPTTLRFWEEQGIVEPEKDLRTQYRRYTPDDSCRFLFVRKYRSFGISLPRVAAMISAGENDRTSALLDRRSLLDAEIDRLVAARAALDRHLNQRKAARALVGRFVSGELPPSYFFPCVERGAVKAHRREVAEACLDKLPSIDFAVLLDPSRPVDGKSFFCSWGYGMDEKVFGTLPEEVRRLALFLPPRSGLFTALLRESARDFTESEYRMLREQSGADLSGPIFGHVLELEESEEGVRYLISLFLPIK